MIRTRVDIQDRQTVVGLNNKMRREDKRRIRVDCESVRNYRIILIMRAAVVLANPIGAYIIRGRHSGTFPNVLPYAVPKEQDQ